jgi:peptidoglycan hydrolase-like protein with peptidoglycan-binding domain
VVKRFQKENGLQVDGIPGPITKSKIKALLAKETED